MRISLKTSATAFAGAAVLALAVSGVSYASAGTTPTDGSDSTAAKSAGSGDAVVPGAKTRKHPQQFQTFLAGKVGDTLDDTMAFRLNVRPGVYDLRFQGAFEPVEQEETGIVECFVTDGHFRKVYAGATSAIGSDGIPLPSAANAIRVSQGTRLLAACFASAPVTYLQPLAVSFAKADGQKVKRVPEFPAPTMRHALAPRI
jgi:hypothetical protein